MARADVTAALHAERARLLAMLVELDSEGLGQAQQSSSSDLSGLDQHLADMGSETYERTKDFSIRQSIVADLQDVDHALAKLARGEYGACEMCGRRISRERLAAKPAARFCIEDQARVERESRTDTER